jgi:uncharacterized protein (DUF1501 family)
MTPRRDFLRSLSLISIAPTVPGFLARSAWAAMPERDARVLVVIQLDGGNDGINTVVPHGDQGYARHRKVLRLETNRLIKVSDGIGLHPAMGEAGKLLESGRLAIVPGVGYPNPNRSHFESMAIWQTARLDPEEHAGPGWLGRAFDGPVGRDPSIFVGSGTPPNAVRGRRASVSAIDRIDDLKLDPTLGRPATGPAGDDLASFVRRSTLDAYASAERLAELALDGSSSRYPSTALAGRLKLVARLLKGGYASRVFYTTQGGYDTHANQAPTHFERLAELSGALKAFLDDLAASKLADRVLVLAFSEFGRRVAENGSGGTDHGTAGPVLLAGPGVRPGMLGPYPSLDDLEGGDLKAAVDFRRVYATALEVWLGLPSEAALGGTFASLPMLRS